MAYVQSVDELSQSLHIVDGTRIHFTKKDVARVFGIPADGKSIFSKTAKHYSGNVTSQLAAGHINVKQLRSIKAAQAIVVRDHDGPMSLINQDEFSIRCFCNVNLTRPCAKHDRVCADYMHIIVQPGQINSYDSAEYVIRRLLEAVSKLKADLASKVKVPYIYGCSLFLQVRPLLNLSTFSSQPFLFDLCNHIVHCSSYLCSQEYQITYSYRFCIWIALTWVHFRWSITASRECDASHMIV